MSQTRSIGDNKLLLFAVAFAYFSFGAITNVAGAIVPKIRESYEVSSTMSTFLAAVFFIAYGITSIPWGVFMEKTSKKTTLVWGSLITAIGVFLFAAISGFYMNMFSMFLCGIGITGLQVALNPLVSDISNPAKYARNLTLFMVINGLGGFLAPQVVTFTKNMGLDWTATYWIFGVLSIIMLVSMLAPKFPEIVEEPSNKIKQNGSLIQEEEKKDHTFEMLTSKPMIYLFALGIFLYVGVEVGVANTIGFYLEDRHNISSALGEDAEGIKNNVISFYWGGLLLGRLLGSAVLDKLKSRTAIKIYIALAALALFLITIGDLKFAIYGFPAVGFFISIMFPTIYSLTTNSFEEKYKSAISGILCTAIIGGAAIGPIIAKVAETFGILDENSVLIPNWNLGFIVAFACYAYIFLLGLIAKEPLQLKD